MTNKIQDAFGHIQADTRLKESTKRFLREQSRGKFRAGYHPAVKYAVSAVCVMLFLAVGGAGYSWIWTPVSYVSIDVNPSIELALNRFDRVVSAEAYNVEGEEILTVVADSANEAKLTEGVKECTSHVAGGCHSTQADINAAPQAHENGISCGKYKAYLELSQYDSSITLEECRKMSMEEIWERIREYEEDSGTGSGDIDSGSQDEAVGDMSETGEGTGCEYGSGNGNGGGEMHRYGNGSSHHGGHHGGRHE